MKSLYIPESLIGLRKSKHAERRIREARENRIVSEVPAKNIVAGGPPCPDCGHGQFAHSDTCKVIFIQENSDGERHVTSCYCSSTWDEILADQSVSARQRLARVHYQ